MSKKVLYLAGNVLIIIVVLVFYFNKNRPVNAIRIGLSINLSGRGGTSGEHIRDGSLLAVEEINNLGGINGSPLELIIMDDQNTEEGVLDADKFLISKDVVAILGHNQSTTSMAAYPLITKHNKLLFSAYAATGKLSKKDDLFLRTSVDSQLYVEKMAKLLGELKLRNIVILLDMTNPDFALDYYLRFQKFFTGKLHRVDIINKINVSWKHVISQLLKNKSSGVLFITEANITGIAAQKLRGKDYKGKFFTTVWSQTPELILYGGKSIEGISIVSYFNPELNTKAYNEFNNKMMRKFNKKSDARSSRGYEAINILADALKRCPDFKTNTIKNALLSSSYKTILDNEVRFDKYGDVVRSIFVSTVIEDEFKLVKEL